MKQKCTQWTLYYFWKYPYPCTEIILTSYSYEHVMYANLVSDYNIWGLSYVCTLGWTFCHYLNKDFRKDCKELVIQQHSGLITHYCVRECVPVCVPVCMSACVSVCMRACMHVCVCRGYVILKQQFQRRQQTFHAHKQEVNWEAQQQQWACSSVDHCHPSQ